MSKNLTYKSFGATHKKNSLSQDSSPLYGTKIKKETTNCFQPADLDSQLKLTPKSAAAKKASTKLTANVFINNLSVQIGPNQNAQRKTPTPLSASITNRKNSKPSTGLSHKEEILLAEYRENKSRQKNRTPQTSLDAAINSGYELRKNPIAIVPRHHSEASNDILKTGYIPKFKGSDPNNKFSLRSPPKAFTHVETATAFKKPNGRKQKSFDANAPMTKYTPYINSYLRPPTTANNSPRDKTDTKSTQSTGMNQMLVQTIGPKVTKNPLDRAPSATKTGSKSSTVVSKHRKTPSYDITKRSESISQKILNPPILDRMRRSADNGEYWQGNLNVFNNVSNKSLPRFAIRTRAGVAPNGTRKVNQDSFVFHTNYGKKSDRYLLGVCDGHGMNGHLVSGFVKETLPVYLLADPSFEIDPATAFTNAFELCLQKLLVCDIDCRFSGTTAAFLLADGNRIMTANAGDSRAIIASFDNGWDFRPLTTDHKPDTPEEAQRIIKCGGRIEPFKDMEGGFVGPARVWLLNQDIPGLAMSRSIGDLVAASVGVSCVPEIKEFTVNSEDKFMIIASDGVWEFIENIDVVKVIVPFYEQNNIEGACDYLMGLSVKRWQEEEEVVVDDITFILVFF